MDAEDGSLSRTGSALTGTRYEILVSCTGLTDLDTLTKSDPMCVLFYKQFGQWREVGRTEAIKNTLNPKFVGSFVLDFDPSVQQNFMFSVYDIDHRSPELRHHDFVGSVELSSLDLVEPKVDICTRCKTLRVPGSARGHGLISITSERIRECRDKVSFHVGAHKLNKKGKLISKKPDVYLEISRSIDNVTFHPIYRTETDKKTQHPRWRPFEIGLQRLCNGDWDRQLELAVWHHGGTGDYKMLGRRVATLRDLNSIQKVGHYKELPLAPKKQGSITNSIKITNNGYLRFFQVRVDCDYSLLDYVTGGMKLNLNVAIDFTASNGTPEQTMSLHDVSQNKKTPYMEVIEAFGGVICGFCTEVKIGMLGFGAKMKKSSVINHCFPLSNDWNRFYEYGIESAISRYKKAVKHIRMSGPTRLKPVISFAESMAVREPTQDNQVYHVLLVITDGILNDIDDVLERLTSISHLPLTVVFAGVGPADFKLMECFSQDSTGFVGLKYRTTSLNRKHTHFVSFSRENGQTIDLDRLARETLAVISSQITEYMRRKDIIPNKPSLTSLPRSHSSVSLIEASQTEGRGLSRKSASRTSLISRNSVSNATDPKCPTCGSVLDNGSSSVTIQSSADVILQG
ncbi:copine-9-like [Mya arenaria]|uniref:copine-9-like n=1 Tax=Mya arenaria TaxID=6604 RepID=UPI0022E66AF7|nr:copine-9-like [Mya arenaria]XP_052807082.1 copine-9-like [Mya arenaria]